MYIAIALILFLIFSCAGKVASNNADVEVGVRGKVELKYRP